MLFQKCQATCMKTANLSDKRSYICASLSSINVMMLTWHEGKGTHEKCEELKGIRSKGITSTAQVLDP